MVIVWPINLNVSCKLHLYSLQGTWGYISPGGLEIRICVIIITSRARILMYIFFFINLLSLVYDVNWWLSGRVSVLNSVVTDSISSRGGHGILCWWDLLRLKQLLSISICRAQVFSRFSGHGNSIHNIISLLKKENVHLYWFQGA